jgi:hypothetical protein
MRVLLSRWNPIRPFFRAGRCELVHISGLFSGGAANRRLFGQVRMTEVTNLILRSIAQAMRLEGWMQYPDSRPSFETALRASSG